MYCEFCVTDSGDALSKSGKILNSIYLKCLLEPAKYNFIPVIPAKAGIPPR
jgi:hypothetical protein